MKILRFINAPQSYLSPSYLKRRFFTKTVSIPSYALQTDSKNNPKLTFCAEGLVSSNYFGGLFDNDFQSILKDLQPQFGQELYYHWRIYFYLQNVMYQLSKCIRESKPFTYVECGVGEAIMLSVVHAYLQVRGGHLFDVFENGEKILMDTFAGVDSSLLTGKYEKLKGTKQTSAYGDATLEKLKTKLQHIKNVRFVEGSIPSTLERINKDQVKPTFLHIDMNNPIPEVAALDFFYPLMETGSVVIFDDYGFPGFEQQNDAINEWCQSHLIPPPICIPTGQSIMIR